MWKNTARSSMSTDDVNTWLKGLEDAYTVTTADAISDVG